jgi:hypothetical protein
MRYTIIFLGLLSIPMLSRAGELPPVDAVIHYTTTETTEEGVVKTLNYQDRWIRDGQTIWSERLIPAGIRAEVEHNEHNEMQAPHEHFNYQTAAQWLVHNTDGSLTLNYVDPVHKAIVYYPPGEYGQANFVPDWTLHSHIFKPAALQKNDPTGQTRAERCSLVSAGKQRLNTDIVVVRHIADPAVAGEES